MDGEKDLAPSFVDVFSEAREITQPNIAVPAPGEAVPGISALVKRAGRLIDRSGLMMLVSLGHVAQHGGAVGEVHATFRARHASARIIRHFGQGRCRRVNQCRHDPLPSLTARSPLEGILAQGIFGIFIVELSSQRCEGGEKSPLLKDSLVRFPRRIDGISDYEANLAHKLVGQPLCTLRGKATRVEAVYSGSVDTSLP